LLEKIKDISELFVALHGKTIWDGSGWFKDFPEDPEGTKIRNTDPQNQEFPNGIGESSDI